MGPMHSPRQAPALTLALVLAAMLAACGGSSSTAAPSHAPSASIAPSRSGAPSPSSAAVATPIATAAADLTPVPGGTVEPSGEPPAGGATTVIDWGTILDRVPEGFPVFPGASVSEPIDGPSSGTWFADGAGVDDVATWYRGQLEELGFTTKDLSSPLEDGSRVLDTVSDLPECRIQTTFRPANGSTMIIVLYGAGCAGGEG